ncbi:DNA/RNA non-specific endonuclease [Mollicutes bacterium LVI A0039]|nr:DNA/RNA non-specific endonuclease [Mollicutes bacterium LVI A0039]
MGKQYKSKKQNNKYKRRKKNSIIQKFIIVVVTFIVLIGYLHNIGLITNNDIISVINQISSLVDIELPSSEKNNSSTTYDYEFDAASIANNKLLTVDSCDLSGSREANVKVDIGYGYREYYAYTNQYKQLVYVDASQITLQDKATENLTTTGRYCSDEANVPGVEDSNLDQGHAIADSIGGVANAYNITPQDSTLNRHGEYSDFEKQIRDALKNGSSVTDFECIIAYDNQNTQIPTSYYVTFKIDGIEHSYYMLNKS